MACTSTAIKTSVRAELKMTSTLLKAGGTNINQCSLSISTIYRQRKREVAIKAERIKDNIKTFGKSAKPEEVFIVTHFDSKIV